MQIRHLHLPKLTPYLRASAIQDHLVRLNLDIKASKTATAAPPPTLLTFQTPPTYTCGRREIGSLSSAQIDHLRAGGKAEFHEALRGGQTTFHGPGQLTAYLILSLQAHNLSPRTHVRLLEEAVVGTCREYSLSAHLTEHPGVWTGPGTDEDRKIASVGVHLRRNVSSHGIGLNVSIDLGWFDRIVACGLVGRKATSIEYERKRLYLENHLDGTLNGTTRGEQMHETADSGSQAVPMEEVADVFAANVAARLPNVERKVKKVNEASVWPGH